MHGLRFKQINIIPAIYYEASETARTCLNILGGDFYVDEINLRQAILINKMECPSRHTDESTNHNSKCEQLMRNVEKVVKRHDKRFELRRDECSYKHNSKCIFSVKFTDGVLF